MAASGKPRKFKTREALIEAWEADKTFCDAHVAIRTEFCQKLGQFVTAEIPAPITYSIEGFCTRNGIARSAFYADYAEDPKYQDIVTRMREECEINARERFETSELPSQLAGLWMSKYGYTTKTDTNVSGAVPVVISGGDGLED